MKTTFFEDGDGFLGPKPKNRFSEMPNVIIKTEPELLIEPDESDRIDDALVKGPDSPVFTEPKIEPRDDFLDFQNEELVN